MNTTLISRELDEIRHNILPGITPREGHHKRLFELFAEIEAAVIENGEPGNDTQAEAKADGLLEAQGVIMNTAARLEARSMNEVLYKLAIWRWFSTELDQPADELQPVDAIAYSAFRDLAEILNERSVLTAFDLAA